MAVALFEDVEGEVGVARRRVKVGNEDVLAEFFTPCKHENNVVLTHFLFQIPRTLAFSVKIGLTRGH